MEIEDQPLLSRKKVVTQIEFDAETPSRKKVRKDIAKEMKTEEELVIVKKIDTAFGFRKASVEAYVYPDKESMKTLPKYLKERHEK